MTENETVQSGNLTRYKELLQQARIKTDEAKRAVAGQFVPQLYEELRNQGFSPFAARSQILDDCVPMWAEETILHLLPSEAKEGAKGIGGRRSAEVRKERSRSEKKYKIMLNHVAMVQINDAIMASDDGRIWIYANAKHDFINAEPVTPKSVTPEAIPMKTAISAPVKS